MIIGVYGLFSNVNKPSKTFLAEFEAEFDANPLLLHVSHFNRSVRSPHSTNTTSQKCTEKKTHALTAKLRLAEWFTKGTSRDTLRHRTVLQEVFVRQSYFGESCVASRITQSQGGKEYRTYNKMTEG